VVRRSCSIPGRMFTSSDRLQSNLCRVISLEFYLEFVVLKGETNHWLTGPEYASLRLEVKTSARCCGGLDYGRAR
jgi:hypothetical protein